MGRDDELMNHVSSINVACGFHAGDPRILRRTVESAALRGLKIGAHPSFPDLQGFGRREMKLEPAEIFDIVLYQTAAVRGICEAFGARLHHVKPHGALYNMAARDRSLAAAIAGAVARIDPGLKLYGLSGSFLVTEGAAAGLETVSEVFADRTYQSDGTLTPRSAANALITDDTVAIAQVVRMVAESVVKSVDGMDIGIRADTVCIHGDGQHAVAFAENIGAALRSRGFEIG